MTCDVLFGGEILYIKQFRAGEMGQQVEHLPRKHKGQSVDPLHLHECQDGRLPTWGPSAQGVDAGDP